MVVLKFFKKGGIKLDEQLICVLDASVSVDFVNHITGKGLLMSVSPTVDLSRVHLVFPTIVVRQLIDLIKERTDRGAAARMLLKWLRGVVENDIHTMDEIYNLKAPVTRYNGNQLVSVVPVHQNFCKCLNFHPADNDERGQIILTTLAVMMTLKGRRIDGSELRGNVSDILTDRVVLLTNDDGLAVRARERGIRTSRYGYQYPKLYTGRRDLTVPETIYRKFMTDWQVEREVFEQEMPSEAELVTNEFIVMRLAPDSEYWRTGDKTQGIDIRNIGRYDAERGAIVPLKHVESFPVTIRNPGQAMYAEALMHPQIKMVVCTGSAGSGKTYMAKAYLRHEKKSGAEVVEVSLEAEHRRVLPVAQGKHELITTYDGFQDWSPSQVDMMLQRLGEEDKIILTGDTGQIHSPYLDEINNGLVYAGQLLMGSPLVARVSFTEAEVVQHPITAEITQRWRMSRC